MTPYTRVWGDGRALLIHCALAHSGVLASFAEQLAGGARAFDLPGHGKSPAWTGEGDYQALCVNWAASVLDGPAPVFGHSFGGTVALRLAVERPELVSRLVLVEPVFFAAMRLHVKSAYEAHAASFAPIAEAYEARDLHRMAERFTAMWGGADWSKLPHRFRDVLAAQMPLIMAQGQGIDADTGGVFAPGRLETCDVPVTLIRGTETQPSVAVIHDVLLGLLPNAEEHVIEGAGHMSPMSHPNEVARLSRL